MLGVLCVGCVLGGGVGCWVSYVLGVGCVMCWVLGVLDVWGGRAELAKLTKEVQKERKKTERKAPVTGVDRLSGSYVAAFPLCSPSP